MAAIRHIGVAALAVLALGGARTAGQAPTATRPTTLDPSALASFVWRPLGLDQSDITRVTTDSAYPYRPCALSDRVSRCLGEALGASPRVWEILPIGDDGPVTPDGADAEVLYTASLRRFDRRTGQSTAVSPELDEQVRGRGLPAVIAFSNDGRTLFAGTRAVWRTSNGGQTWTPVSPTLLGDDASGRITALAVSPIDARVIWAGTSRGTVHLTRDGGVSWVVVTPAALGPAAPVAAVEASRFDPQSVYLAAASDPGATASLWRTRDLGASWTSVSRTLPAAAGVRAVREDLFRRGLLFAATDRSVFFSIDDGESWQSLQNNLPDVAVTDLAVRDADLVVGTRGRGVWVLDDFSPLRQITPDVLAANVFLFRPPQTWRARALPSGDVPSPAGADAAWNTGGVAFSYLIGRGAIGPLQIDVIETLTGDLIRRFSSDPSGRQPGDALLSLEPGLRRVVWDLRYGRPEADLNAPPAARVLPGTYQVRLTIGGQSLRQSVAVRADPRMRATPPDLAAQRTLARSLDRRRGEVVRAIDALDAAAAAAVRSALIDSRDQLRRLTRIVNDVDDRPSAAIEAAAAAALGRAAAAVDALAR